MEQHGGIEKANQQLEVERQKAPPPSHGGRRGTGSAPPPPPPHSRRAPTPPTRNAPPTHHNVPPPPPSQSNKPASNLPVVSDARANLMESIRAGKTLHQVKNPTVM